MLIEVLKWKRKDKQANDGPDNFEQLQAKRSSFGLKKMDNKDNKRTFARKRFANVEQAKAFKLNIKQAKWIHGCQ